MEMFVHLKVLNDFIHYVGDPFYNNVVPDANTLLPLSCSYNDDYKAFRINDSSTTTRGSLNIPVGFLEIGDTVEIEFEAMSVSGIKPKIAIDYYSNNQYTNLINTQLTFNSDVGSEFSNFKCVYTNPYARHGMVVIGTFTADIGDFYIRNVNIRIKSTRSTLGKTYRSYVESKRMYTFRGSSSGFQLQQTYTNDTCTITLENDDILITHSKPFSYQKGGVGIVSVSGSSSFNISARARSETPTSLRIRFFETNTGNIIKPNTLQNNESLWFSLTHQGYEYDRY